VMIFFVTLKILGSCAPLLASFESVATITAAIAVISPTYLSEQNSSVVE